MPSPGSSNKKILMFALIAAVAGVATVFAPGEKPAPVTPAVAPPPPQTVPPTAQAKQQTKDEAMTALMSLPELKAWSQQLEKSSGGAVRGALIEYDQTPKVVNGKSYWQFSFVENGSEAAHRWESFLVSDSGEILVEDFKSDKQMSLEQWRKEKRPMERTTP